MPENDLPVTNSSVSASTPSAAANEFRVNIEDSNLTIREQIDRKPVILLAIDQHLADDVIKKLQSEGIADKFEIIVAGQDKKISGNGVVSVEVDSYKAADAIRANAKRIAFLVVDDNMSGSESGVSMALRHVKEHEDCHFACITGTRKPGLEAIFKHLKGFYTTHGEDRVAAEDRLVQFVQKQIRDDGTITSRAPSCDEILNICQSLWRC